MAKSWQSVDGLINISGIPDYVDTDSYDFMQKVRNKYRDNKVDVPKQYQIDIGEIGEGFMSNAIPSTVQLGQDLATAVLNPIDTISNILDVGKGTVQYLLPDKVFESGLIDKDKESIEKAKMMGNFYKSRYGSIELAKETFAKDPAAVLADASMFLTGGAGAIAKTGQFAKTSGAIRKTGELLDPLALAGYGVKGLAYPATKLGTVLPKIAAARLSGTGTKPFEEAFKAGEQYGKSKKGKTGRQRADFWKYYSGAKKPLTIVDELRNAFRKLSDRNNTKWEKGVEALKENKTVPDYTALGQSLNKINAEVIDPSSGFVVNAAVAKTLEDTQKIIDEFANKPELQNLYGFELLRKRIQADVKDRISYDTKAGKSQSRAVDKVLSSIKQTISKAEPSYADMIGKYAEASAFMDDFSSTLGQLTPAGKAQALNKFFEGINNPTGDFAVTLNMIQEAELISGKNIEAMLSGAILNNVNINNFSGRGLVGLGGVGQVIPGTQAAGMPLSIPKVAGGVAYGAGRVKGAAEKIRPEVGTRGLFNVGVQPTRADIPTTEEELRQLLINRQLNR